MSYYSSYSEISRSPSTSTTPSNQSFTSNVRKRESWCDQTLKLSFLAEISEVEEFSSPRYSRSGVSRPRSRHSFHCDEDPPLYILPHIKNELKHHIVIPKRSIPLGLFFLEKTGLDNKCLLAENDNKTVKINETPKFQIDAEKKERSGTPGYQLKENNIGYSFSKGLKCDGSISRNYTESAKILETSRADSKKTYTGRSCNDSFVFNCKHEVKKLEFEENEIKLKNSKPEEKFNPIEPIKWDFEFLKNQGKKLENKIETPIEIEPSTIMDNKKEEIASLSKFFTDSINDFQVIKNNLEKFNEYSKELVKQEKLNKKNEKKQALEIRLRKIQVLKIRASEIPLELRWRRYIVLNNGENVEIRNHTFTRSSCYSGNLIYKKYSADGSIELAVYKGFYNNRKIESVWENFLQYFLRIVNNDESKALIEISNYWLVFLKFERRVSRIEKIVDSCEISSDQCLVNLKGRLNSLAWQIYFHFSKLEEKYSLEDMIFDQLLK